MFVRADRHVKTGDLSGGGRGQAWCMRADSLSSVRLQRLAASFGARPELTSVAADPQCQRCLEENQLAWRQIVAQV